MIVSIHQPSYLPWLGYFDRIKKSDLFIFLDTVQFQKQSFQNRTKIRTSKDWAWLTVPMLTKGRLFSSSLNEMLINNQHNWQRKHLESIKTNYIKAENYQEIYQVIEPFYLEEKKYLSNLCFDMLNVLLDFLNIKTKVVRASELQECESRKGELILDLCKQVNAEKYLSGPFGREYLDKQVFSSSNIEVLFHDYIPTTYKQVYPGFESNMSILDLLMNVNLKDVERILPGESVKQ